MKYKTFLSEIENTPPSSPQKSTIKRNLRETTSENDYTTKKVKVSVASRLFTQNDSSSKMQALTDYHDWAGDWRLFLIKHFDNILAEVRDDDLIRQEHIKLKTNLNTLCQKYRIESHESLSTYFENFPEINTTSNIIPTQNKINRILDAAEQVEMFDHNSAVNEKIKHFISTSTKYHNKINRALHTNNVELINIQLRCRDISIYASNNPTYSIYKKVSCTLKDEILPILINMQHNNHTNLDNMQMEYAKLKNAIKNNHPIKFYAISILDERILILQRDIKLFETQINTVTSYKNTINEKLGELENIAHQTCEIENHTANNPLLTEESHEIEHQKEFTI